MKDRAEIEQLKKQEDVKTALKQTAGTQEAAVKPVAVLAVCVVRASAHRALRRLFPAARSRARMGLAGPGGRRGGRKSGRRGGNCASSRPRR